MRITVLGARGFVGSAFVRHLRRAGQNEIVEVTRENYRQLAGTPSDVVVDAAGNSKKFLADRDVLQDFDLSVTHRLRTLVDFPAQLNVHISSVDVYSDLTRPESTRETSAIDLSVCSHYGMHKLLAEELVRHHARRWLILRLAGMVGEGLRKNPVFDILHDKPIFIHPDSQYQFMATDEVARIGMLLVERGIEGEVFNVCGNGLISPREVARIAGRELVLSDESRASRPRIVDINIGKLKSLMPVGETVASVTAFIAATRNP